MDVSWQLSFDHRKSAIQSLSRTAIRDPKPVWVFALALAFLVSSVNAGGQEGRKLPRVGFLTSGSSSTIADRIAALRLGLRELGYIEDNTILIEWRFGEGKLERIPALVTELVHLKVDVLVSAGSSVTGPFKEATKTIPIVMTQDTDPVGNGFVASLARPGGNITGLSSYSAELNGKRVEILKEIVPRLSRLALIGQSTYPGNAQAMKEAEVAAAAYKVQVQYLDVLDSKDIDRAFQEATKNRAIAVLVLQNNILNSHRRQVTDLAAKTGLPAIYYAPEFLDSGGLINYAPSINSLYRRSAAYVDKILKGAKPADLPVEQPTKFELVINLKSAKQIGLTIPPNVLARADRVIR